MVKFLSKIKKKLFPGQNFIDPPEDIIANRPKTVESLLEVKKMFEKYEIVFWLDYGTLLGAVRDGAIIPWDHDIDFGAIKNEEEFTKIINAGKELQAQGYEIYYFLDRGMINMRKPESLPISLHLYDLDEKTARLDLAIPRNFKGNCYSYLWWTTASAKYAKNDQRSKVIIESLSEALYKAYHLPRPLLRGAVNCSALPLRLFSKDKIRRWLPKIEQKSKRSTQFLNYEYNRSDFDKLDKVTFYGEEFNIPNNLDEHLSRTYGQEWRKPNPKYVDENDNLLFVKSKTKQKEELKQAEREK